MEDEVIVAHPHKQHSFQLARAMEEGGLLGAYATTVYDKPGSLTSFLLNFLSARDKEKAKSRRSLFIPDSKVKQICEARGLLYLLLLRLTKNDKRIMEPLDAWINNAFGKKLAKYAMASNVSAVVSYDTQSSTLFSELSREGSIAKVLDVSAANLLYLKEIYESDMQLAPQFSELLLRERPLLLGNEMPKRYFDALNAELKASDYFIVPSEFVRNSLLSSGVSADKVFVQPYGIDPEEYGKKSSYSDEGPLRCIYVGGVKQLKGIGYLLEAFSAIDKNVSTLTVVGAGSIENTCLERYKESASFLGEVLHGEIPSLLRQHDLFLFPSLGDSFGLAPLEAAASGLPLVVSKNVGLADYMQDGKEGFIIEPHSSEAIKERVMWFAGNRDAVESMGIAARKMAEGLTWEKYHKGIQGIMGDILRRHGGSCSPTLV